MKRLLAIVLVICMIISVLPINGLAAEYEGESGNISWHFDSLSGVLTISGTGKMLDYSSYGSPWNAYRTIITSVVISSGVTRIGSNAFYDCENLEKISIPESVTEFGDAVFTRCAKLKDVILPSGLTKMGVGVFELCISLTSLNVPEGVRYLDNKLFWGCSSLETVTIPSKVINIGAEAFYGCASLKELNLPASLESIGQWAFNGCASIQEVHIPDGIRIVGLGLFAGCENMKTIQLPENLLEIGSYAFDGCVNLENISIPASVKKIGERAFQNCAKIKSLTLLPGVTQMGNWVFQNCTSLNISCVENTCAYDHVIENSIPYTLIEPPSAEEYIIHVFSEGPGEINALPSSMAGYNMTIKIEPETNNIASAVFLYIESENRMTLYVNQPEITLIMPAEDVYVKAYFWESGTTKELPFPRIYQSTENSYDTPPIIVDMRKAEHLILDVSVDDTSRKHVVVKEIIDDSQYTVSVECTETESGVQFEFGQSGIYYVIKLPRIYCDFEDVSSDSFCYNAVIWAKQSGITTGKTETLFDPSGSCTRAQVVTFLWRSTGQPQIASSENPFPDVPEGKYYSTAVLWAVENGITAGFKDGTFGPNKTCTRGQIVTFLWRYFGEPEPYTRDNTFPDVDLNAYYGKAVLWAVENGITTGFKDGTFGPNKTCTRDQIVTFLYRGIAGGE